jgi:hypothetical protein
MSVPDQGGFSATERRVCLPWYAPRRLLRKLAGARNTFNGDSPHYRARSREPHLPLKAHVALQFPADLEVCANRLAKASASAALHMGKTGSSMLAPRPSQDPK